MVDRLVRGLVRRRWAIAGIWVVGLVVAGLVSMPLPSLLSGGGWSVDGSDSAVVQADLAHDFVGRGNSDVMVVVVDHWYTSDQPGFAKRVARVMDDVGRDPDLEVRDQVGYSTTAGPLQQRFVGKDKRTAIDQLGLDLEDGTARRVLPQIQSDLSARFAGQGLDVTLVGTAAFWGAVNTLSEEGLVHAELLTFPLILIVLVGLFGGLVAALASLAVGITAILGSFAVLTVIAQHADLSLFVQNTATMLGLGVGIDYSLFVIARFKEELSRGRTVDDALAATLRTSGETVLFSGITILAAMSTLFLVPLEVISSIALGAVIVVAFSMLTSLLLLPVLLRLLGHRISKGRISFIREPARPGAHRAPHLTRWERVAHRVMGRPLVFLGLGLLLLVSLAVPASSLTTFTPDAQIVPQSSPVRAGFDHVQDQFGIGTTAPIQVVVSSPRPLTSSADATELARLDKDLAALPSVDRVESALPVLALASPRSPLAALQSDARDHLPPGVRAVVGHYVSADATKMVFDVVPTGHAADAATVTLLTEVHRVAGEFSVPDASIRVGGETAQGIESNAVISDRLPMVVGVMLAVIYLLLLVTFRSVLLPLKAILMNLVSVAATFGVLVLVFQHGVGASLLGAEGSDHIQNFVPILLLTLLFSLSTDYEVFLLNRVREEFVKTGDNARSVAVGMSSTAPLISGAALLMVVVFGSFALAGILPIKQLGFGMAVAIAIDATIVRLVLVPATMRLMGAWNWWMPGRTRHAVAAPHVGQVADPAR
ncbi:MAG: MMPL family transporter [Micrococcales bacterium]|nr:MMPL family transporter [Micrococcales bacterium]